jgi:uncharacterized protein (TIGR02118 family)
MLKVIMFVPRRKDLSVQQFRDHYENVHVPLAHAALRTLRAYVRNYPETTLSGSSPSFDAITELWFDDEAAWKAAAAAGAAPEGQALRADEENFMDRAGVVAVLVKECSSTLPAPVATPT